MKEQFVSYEIASKLKELGFDEECLGDYYIIPSDKTPNPNGEFLGLKYEDVSSYTRLVSAPLWQQVIDWCDSKGLLVGTIIVDNLYKSTINKINYETELFHSRNESIKQAIAFAISYLQDNK